MPRITKPRRAECLTRLHALLQPGDTVFGTINSVSRSGMSRRIDFHLYRTENDPRNPHRVWLTPFVADLLGLAWNDHGAQVDGCGMDMVFGTIYDLGATMYPKGVPCTGEGCRSNDHSNGDRNYTPNTPSHRHWHEDGGYAFRVGN